MGNSGKQPTDGIVNTLLKTSPEKDCGDVLLINDTVAGT